MGRNGTGEGANRTSTAQDTITTKQEDVEAPGPNGQMKTRENGHRPGEETTVAISELTASSPR
eukprot:scaffold422870_cov34-Prasinocladus_malaysianus.AAC.1